MEIQNVQRKSRLTGESSIPPSEVEATGSRNDKPWLNSNEQIDDTEHMRGISSVLCKHNLAILD
jgi:hypothetical protein